MANEKKFSSYLLYALGEVLLIVVGIVIALQLQNWNEANKTTEATQLTIDRIKKEILSNQKKIEQVYDYHKMVSDTLQKIKTPKTEEEVESALSFWRGLRIPRMQESSFQTAIQTGVSKNIDIDLLESLNTLYTFQSSYNDFSKTASQGLYNKDFSEVENFKKIAIFINMTMVDLYYFESDLNRLFQKCLHKIDSLTN
ncbi:DUF6090 family protein [Pseudotenacibaculum haliotis]|uniref:DUF6090 family protein n=1 Tax=Pseudotenacibaculum haliotis TaxID=1862138 RepID=A0ABW5LWP2_9FLAO